MPLMSAAVVAYLLANLFGVGALWKGLIVRPDILPVALLAATVTTTTASTPIVPIVAIIPPILAGVC